MAAVQGGPRTSLSHKAVSVHTNTTHFSCLFINIQIHWGFQFEEVEEIALAVAEVDHVYTQGEVSITTITGPLHTFYAVIKAAYLATMSD